MQSKTPKKYDIANANINITHNSSWKKNMLVSGGEELMHDFPHPPCWSNDQYMDELMGAFRLRSVNPQGYDFQMQFWQDMISSYCEFKRSASFNKREVQLAFARKEQLPYGLDNVIAEMLKTKRIRMRAEYEYDPENTWTGWAINSFVKKPLWWGLSKIPIVGGAEQDLSKAEYVHLAVIKKLCNNLQIKVLEQRAGQLVHYETLKQDINEKFQLSEDSICLCLHTLHCQRRIGLEYKIEDNKKHIHLVKIPSKTDESVEITETNRAIHNLQMTQQNLLQQLEDLEDDIKLNDEKARQYVKEGKRQLAKTYLRKKHLLEKNHEKRSLALNNVETLLCSVEETQSNGEILDAYKIGSKALQNMLNSSGLKYDNVDEVISDVRETFEKHNEIQDTLANANIADSMLSDDDSLESELREILGEAERNTSIATLKHAKGTAKSNTPTSTMVNTNNNNDARVIKQIDITDAELLAMLEGLEVEDSSPTKTALHTKDTISSV